MLKRVVAYDDTPALLTLFEHVLTKEGFEVILSISRMTCFEIEQLQVDLIILGYIRGYLDNELDSLRQLRQNVCLASIPVIICTTGAEQLQNREEILSDSRLMVVSKPFAIEQLLRAANLLLNNHQFNAFNRQEVIEPISSTFHLTPA